MTHPSVSFVPVRADSHFPIQNLPYGVFSTAAAPTPRVGVAIGDHVLDLAIVAEKGLVDGAPDLFRQPTLNAFIASGRAQWSRTRRSIAALLDAANPRLRDDAALRAQALAPIAQARMALPFRPAGYTDYYSSREHATNVGKMFRDPNNALLPNWLHMPIGYNGRASTVVVSDTPIRRPNGQLKDPSKAAPEFGPSRKLDFELETGFVIGAPSTMGERVTVADAEGHMFGMVLLNDWSARDIQQWEYVPLGPFNSKIFATSISPWVVTMEALAPFRVEGPVQEIEPLPYLRQTGRASVDLKLEVSLLGNGERDATTICRTNFSRLYWSMAQQLAHHTVGGCSLEVGDLMGSGTISGPEPDSFGSLLELTWNGRDPIRLPSGAMRSFIEDGDEIIMTGWCQGEGYRVGFGEVRGRVLPALAMS